jgi:hypothetical protein
VSLQISLALLLCWHAMSAVQRTIIETHAGRQVGPAAMSDVNVCLDVPVLRFIPMRRTAVVAGAGIMWHMYSEALQL